MQIDLSDKEISNLKHLGKCLDNNVVPVDDVKKLIDGLRLKTEQSVAPKIRKTETLKDKYRLKLIAK